MNKLHSKRTWYHTLSGNDWTVNGYNKICDIKKEDWECSFKIKYKYNTKFWYVFNEK